MQESAEKPAPIRPDPMATRDSAFFWEGAARGELLIQQCEECRHLWHPPRPMCPHCHGVKMGAARMSGRATVYSWIVPVHPPVFGFAAPPVVALIDLEEGVRLVSNVVGVAPEAMRNDMNVTVAFEPTQGGKAVPVFRPSEGKA